MEGDNNNNINNSSSSEIDRSRIPAIERHSISGTKTQLYPNQNIPSPSPPPPPTPLPLPLPTSSLSSTGLNSSLAPLSSSVPQHNQSNQGGGSKPTNLIVTPASPTSHKRRISVTVPISKQHQAATASNSSFSPITNHSSLGLATAGAFDFEGYSLLNNNMAEVASGSRMDTSNIPKDYLSVSIIRF